MNWTDNKNKNFWEDPEWFKARNAEIVKDKKEGKLTNAQLIAKYNVTWPVIKGQIRKGLNDHRKDI